MPESSFAKSLFHGVIAEDSLLPYPSISHRETDAVQALLVETRRLCDREIDARAIDEASRIPDAVVLGLRRLGLFGASLPREHGGLGLSTSATARVLEEIAGVDASVALMLGAHLALGTSGPLLFGTTGVKERYLRELASGERIGAFALSEVGAGSDAAAIETRADRDGEDYVLRGTKTWVTNGDIAGLFTVIARTSPKDEDAKPRLTAFVVPRQDGVTVGPSEPKLGVRGAATNPIALDGARVGTDHVLGDVGRGFKVAVEVLNRGRLLLASGCVGACKRLLKLSVERARTRKAFARPLDQFGLVQDKLARMMADTFALESMVYLTTGLVDRNVDDFSVEGAICKVFGSEALLRVADEALQIAGGSGYARAQPYERMFRDARVNPIFEGTNEILRCFVALSGMQGPGEAIAEVSRAMREPIKGFGLLSDFALRKARGKLGRDRLTRVHPCLAREAVILEEYTQDLAKNVDKVLRRHGKNIAEMQYTQRRIADMAIDLFGISAVLSRTTRAIERRGEEGSRREIELATVFAAAAQRRLEATVHAFDKNDDEVRKGIAARASVDGGYPFDVLA